MSADTAANSVNPSGAANPGGAASPADTPALQRTPLQQQHVALGARMVPFAGYEMPVQYPLGILKEHLWTRQSAGLFDVSHMGQALLIAEDGQHATVARVAESLLPADIRDLSKGQMRYSQLLNDDGGILDDLMVLRPAEENHTGGLMLIVNASRKEVDFEHISRRLPQGLRLVRRPENALLALQGPEAAAVLGQWLPDAAQMPFMSGVLVSIGGADCLVMRSGYTGEDGFEIVVRAADAGSLWQRLLDDDRVMPIGLGARDSLRLEAGLPLYGHELDETTSPVEAALAWSIPKRRREEGGFPGAARIKSELRDGARRVRVGIRPEGKAPARDGSLILSSSGDTIGIVTSGGFGPSVNGPVAMGYISPAHAAAGTSIELMVRGKPLAARIAKLPFVPHRYFRKAKPISSQEGS